MKWIPSITVGVILAGAAVTLGFGIFIHEQEKALLPAPFVPWCDVQITAHGEWQIADHYSETGVYETSAKNREWAEELCKAERAAPDPEPQTVETFK